MADSSAPKKNFTKTSPKGHKYEITNKQFAIDNYEFQSACINAGIKPTSRQASKFRNKKGSAFKNK